MKIYHTQKEIEADIKNNELFVDGDVKFECSFIINANLRIAGDIDARDINAWDINAENINAGDIIAWDIIALNINANNILYYAFCCVYNSIKCKSIKSKRDKAHPPMCLDGKLEINEDKMLEITLEQIAEKFGKDVKDIKIKK